MISPGFSAFGVAIDIVDEGEVSNIAVASGNTVDAVTMLCSGWFCMMRAAQKMNELFISKQVFAQQYLPVHRTLYVCSMC